MRCYTTDGKGLDSLRRIARDDPPPPAPGEATVEVRAVSLNYRDLLVATGNYGGICDPPIIPCSDMAGVVTAIGPGVTSLTLGDRVVNHPFRNWPDGPLDAQRVRTFIGGASVDGVLAERINYPAAALFKIPDHLSFAHAATLPVAGLTAWAALVTHGHIKPGQWIVAHGTGGVSIFAAQIAKLLGARVIVTTSDETKAAILREKFHVDHTLDYRDNDWPDRVRQLTSGGAHVVVETAGGDTLARSISCCTYEGRVMLIGVLDGFAASIPVIDMLARQITVRGIYMESAAVFRDFLDFTRTHRLTPHIDRTFDFDETPAAFKYLESRKHMGKIVIERTL